MADGQKLSKSLDELSEFERLLAAELEPYGDGAILLALSGGADSTALVAAFARLRELNLLGTISVCHVNHGQRAEAALDEEFCRGLCRTFGLPLKVMQLASRADFKSGAGEEELRLWRYQALGQAALECGAAFIATAHNLDDQAETLLFRLFRGSAPRGLAAMKKSRDLLFSQDSQAEVADLTLIRPLLSRSRREILAYLQGRTLSFREDASNQDRRFKRNYIRHEIMPRVLEAFPEALSNIENLRLILASEDAYLEKLAARALADARTNQDQSSLDAVCLLSLDAAILGRVLVLYMEERGVEPSFSRVAAFAGALSGGRLSLGDGLELTVHDGLVRLDRETSGAVEAEMQALRSWMTPLKVRLPDGEQSRLTIIPWLNRALRVEREEQAGPQVFPEKTEAQILVDPAALYSAQGGELVFRLRREGDLIMPFGMNQVVRLKQYLRVNHKQADRSLWKGTPLANLDEEALRRLSPVLALGEEVLWVPGWGLSEKLRAGAVSGLMRLSLIELAS